MRAASLAVLAFLALVAAISLAAPSARAPAGMDAGGNPHAQLVVFVEFPGDIVQSGEVLPLRVRVIDTDGNAIPGATVTVLVDGGTVTPASAVTDGSGFARFSFSANVAASTEVAAQAEARLVGAISGSESFTVTVVPMMESRPLIGGAETVGAGIGAAILAAVASTEFGKYGLSNVVFFPLYSRLRKDEVLDHFVRGQIYGYIAAHPGEHYNSLKEALKVTNGTLAHHLRTLEMQGFVKADRDGVFKRFYPVEMQIPRDKGIRLSDLQHHILGLIRNDGGPTQQEIAERLDVSQQTVSYNLRHLSREGLVRTEKDGRATRYFPPDT